jgi:hypothetical protein
MATQTEVLRQILQTQQQIAQQMNRGPPHGANHEGPNLGHHVCPVHRYEAADLR